MSEEMPELCQVFSELFETLAAELSRLGPGQSDSVEVTRRVLRRTFDRLVQDVGAFERRRKAEKQRDAMIEQAWAVYEACAEAGIDTSRVNYSVFRQLTELSKLLDEHDCGRATRIRETLNARVAAESAEIAKITGIGPPVTPASLGGPSPPEEAAESET